MNLTADTANTAVIYPPFYDHPPPPTLSNASNSFMARSSHSPPMNRSRRSEEEGRERHSIRSRERDGSTRHTPSPSRNSRDTLGRGDRGNRRAEADGSRRARSPEYPRSRPGKSKEIPEKAVRSKYSGSNKSKSSHAPPDRFRDNFPIRSPKRQRTRSPSPGLKNHRATGNRGEFRQPRSRSHSGNRDRPDLFERRGFVDRPYSSRNTSPRRSRHSSRPPVEVDSYVPSSRRRTPTPPPSNRAANRSKSPISRAEKRRERRFSKSKPRLKPQSPSRQQHSNRSSNRASAKRTRRDSRVDESDKASMDGHFSSRGNHGIPKNMMHNRPPQRPYVDTRSYPQFGGSPPFGTPNSSYHGSPQSGSPYTNRGGGWTGPQQQLPHGPNPNLSPPFRQNSFPGPSGPQSQGPFYPNQQQQPHFPQHHSPQGFQQPAFRGGHNSHRGGHFSGPPPDRRTSAPGQHGHGNSRGRGGHFNNLQWTANSSKRGGPQTQGLPGNRFPSNQTSPAQSQHGGSNNQEQMVEDERITRPPGDIRNKHNQKDNPKFSFAFKSKAPPSAPSKGPPDLNNRPKGPPRGPESRQNHGPHDRAQDRPNDRGSGRTPDDHRDFSGKKPPFPHHNDKKHSRPESPPSKKQKQEPRPRPQLPPELAQSESVYYRKPGNESVVGAGTYGKVFRAIHIYTKDKVALKKIRMEGERDGFPITAVREIRLLQHLRHKHVVALQEVMVEKNECFMVFEYLSHDLTGLINHPTFKLTPAHKKDLARQMFEGLDFLHRRGVLHRDIKAANILVSNSGQLKYADFGLARFYTKSRQLDYTNRVITIWYRPPELLLGETQYGTAVDIWSAACVFVEMFTKKAIFPGEGGELSQLEKVYNVLGTPTRTDWPAIVDLPWFELMQPVDRRKRIFEETFQSFFSPAALELLQAMFQYNPERRPHTEQVLAHPYFTEEEPRPQQAVELKYVEGDWHEFESKAHRREQDRKEKDRKKEEYMRDREKRKARDAGLSESGLEEKRPRPDHRPGDNESRDDQDHDRSTTAGANDNDEDSDGEGSARMSMS